MTASSMPSSAMGPARRRRRQQVLAAVAGLVVAALVAIGGVLFWEARPAESRAVATIVVLPASEGVEVASYYDTLSNGQIATTFAEILALRGTEGSTLDADVEVEVVPGTSLIQIAATASEDDTAEAAANAALAESRPYFDQLSSPYDVFEVQSADGTAEDAGLAVGLVSGVVAAVAVIAGLASYLAARALQGAGVAAPAPAVHPSVTDGPNGSHRAATARDVSGNGVPTKPATGTDLPTADEGTAQPPR